MFVYFLVKESLVVLLLFCIYLFYLFLLTLLYFSFRWCCWVLFSVLLFACPWVSFSLSSHSSHPLQWDISLSLYVYILLLFFLLWSLWVYFYRNGVNIESRFSSIILLFRWFFKHWLRSASAHWKNLDECREECKRERERERGELERDKKKNTPHERYVQ